MMEIRLCDGQKIGDRGSSNQQSRSGKVTISQRLLGGMYPRRGSYNFGEAMAQCQGEDTISEKIQMQKRNNLLEKKKM